jgi:hypothetical protein
MSAPALTYAIILIPTVIGFFFSYQLVAATPLLRLWQFDQSVAPLDALLLTGYLAHYAQVQPAYVSWAMYLLAALSALGIFCLRDNRSRWMAAGYASLFLFATGLRGPLAQPYGFLIDHARPIGLFRELYDLLAYAIILYLLLSAAALRRWPRLQPAVFAVSLALVAGWVTTPPTHYFVDSANLPYTRVEAAPHTRFALFPPFQPLQVGKGGSGIDPDTFDRPNGVSALNSYLAPYPADAALALWLQRRDSTLLRALSVSQIIERPWFTTNPQTQAYAPRPVGPHRASAPAFETLALATLPETFLVTGVQTVAIPPKPGDENIFFTDDARQARSEHFHAFEPTLDSIRGDLGWISAPLAFVNYPEIAQGVGGIFTTSRASVPIEHGASVLVYIQGTLLDDKGRTLGHDTNGYAWITPPRRTEALVCHGECALAGQGTPPLDLPMITSQHAVRPLATEWHLPWLLSIAVPPGTAGIICLNASFAPGWVGLRSGRLLPHVRLDSVSNGWSLSQTQLGGTLWIFYFPAMCQMAAELAAVLWIAYLIAWYALQLARSRRLTN